MAESNTNNLVIRDNDQLEAYLAEHDLVTQKALDASKLEAGLTGEDVGIILVRNGFIRQSELVDLRINVDASNLSRERVTVSSIPADFLIDSNTVMVAETSEILYAATLSPEIYVQTELAKHDPRDVQFVSLSVSDLNDYLLDLQRLRSQDDDSLLERIIRNALREGVSDIHIRPRVSTYTILYRYLGVCHIVHEGQIEEYQVLSSRIKDNSKMDLSERRIPQGGSFQIEFKRNMVDLRVESLPSSDGEIIVIRLLNPDSVNPNLNNLGITGVEDWRRGFNRAEGLCLVCGPTGSGKTTTMNSTVREIDRFERAIYTIEDPVEYNIPYIGQVNVNNAVGLDFSKALRSFMRADPDVIIIGEVRDEETADNMVKAAETGHLVIATLHAGSIHGTVSRLREIGVNPRDLRYLLRSILVQRLIRVLCKHCNGEGCAFCHDTGYGGRTIVSECAYFKDEHESQKMIDGEKWWDDMVVDAVKKYQNGDTDKKEILRVFAGEAENLLNDQALQDEYEDDNMITGDAKLSEDDLDKMIETKSEEETN